MKRKSLDPSLLNAISGVLILVFVLWGIEIFNLLTGHELNRFGIFPRQIENLPGIIVAPFLHGSLLHVAMNTIPLVVLGILISLKNHRTLVKSTAIIVLCSGFGVWLVGRPGYHVGASGLIFGYFGFLLSRGWYGRDFGSILIAVLTVSLYGGMFWGIVPVEGPISWEAHLFGFLGGILAARAI